MQQLDTGGYILKICTDTKDKVVEAVNAELVANCWQLEVLGEQWALLTDFIKDFWL